MSCSAVEIVYGSSVRLACHNLVGAATGLDDVYLSGSEGQRVGASLAAQSLLVASVEGEDIDGSSLRQRHGHGVAAYAYLGVAVGYHVVIDACIDAQVGIYNG